MEEIKGLIQADLMLEKTQYLLRSVEMLRLSRIMEHKDLYGAALELRGIAEDYMRMHDATQILYEHQIEKDRTL